MIDRVPRIGEIAQGAFNNDHFGAPTEIRANQGSDSDSQYIFLQIIRNL